MTSGHFPAVGVSLVVRDPSDFDPGVHAFLSGIRRVLDRLLDGDQSGQPERLLKVEEVAARLAISRSKVYELISGGHLPTRRIGRSVRVPERALSEWIARGTVGLHQVRKDPRPR